MGGRFTWRQRRLIEWLSSPPSRREPDSAAKLADELGIAIETLDLWARQTDIAAEVRSRARQSLHIHLPDVLDTLVAKAREGSFQHLKLYLELTGVYRKDEQDGTEIFPGADLSSLDERELRTLADMEDLTGLRSSQSRPHGT